MTKLTASHWGAGIATTDGARLLDVTPHPDDPNPSPINGNIASSLNGGARVLQPAVREGWLDHGPGAAQGRRGKDRFVEVG